jgi:1-acyl-sn-glycerol-3-phosphate acyltransferase
MLNNELISYPADGTYRTPTHAANWIGRLLPTGVFYTRFLCDVLRSSRLAIHGRYDNAAWARSSFRVLKSLESVGVQVEISGCHHIRQLKSPCVFVGNHMSTLETTVLPSIIQPICDVTFVVKQSLLDYPVFKHVVRSRDPIAVTRTKPRDDFKSVMQGGVERLARGISIVVFPQTTRSLTFEPDEFNTIGIKLAQKAGVPVIPIALKTDAWGNGNKLKDFGRIDPNKKVHFAFGPPIGIRDRGAEQHRQVIEFIQQQVSRWQSNTNPIAPQSPLS